MDTHGRNLFAEVGDASRERLRRLLEEPVTRPS
jgi:hypothetical protein